MARKRTDNDGALPEGSLDEEEPIMKPKGVHFGSVRVRTHHVVLGDNPSVSKGPPMTLAWDPTSSDRYMLDEFERIYGDSALKEVVRVSVKTRENWLTDNGHTKESFRRVQREIRDVKRNRRESRRDDPFFNRLGHPRRQRMRSNSPPSRPRRYGTVISPSQSRRLLQQMDTGNLSPLPCPGRQTAVLRSEKIELSKSPPRMPTRTPSPTEVRTVSGSLCGSLPKIAL